jgi:hypothetical protein
MKYEVIELKKHQVKCLGLNIIILPNPLNVLNYASLILPLIKFIF